MDVLYNPSIRSLEGHLQIEKSTATLVHDNSPATSFREVNVPSSTPTTPARNIPSLLVSNHVPFLSSPKRVATPPPRDMEASGGHPSTPKRPGCLCTVRRRIEVARSRG
ncbi:hypothetical protein HBI80_252430 [Parastagonospora nodorum]|nr:hypothetical protein HBI80_252430 [Parastagonospora nodorum]KAH5088427.1 hypothetical protein HBH72_245980 [Parastagonospora nodorum]